MLNTTYSTRSKQQACIIYKRLEYFVALKRDNTLIYTSYVNCLCIKPNTFKQIGIYHHHDTNKCILYTNMCSLYIHPYIRYREQESKSSLFYVLTQTVAKKAI